jgi:hypothetical protein
MHVRVVYFCALYFFGLRRISLAYLIRLLHLVTIAAVTIT